MFFGLLTSVSSSDKGWPRSLDGGGTWRAPMWRLALLLHGSGRCDGCSQLVRQLCRVRVGQSTVSSWSGGSAGMWPSDTTFRDSVQRRCLQIVVTGTRSGDHWTTYRHHCAVAVVQVASRCSTSPERHLGLKCGCFVLFETSF